MVHCSLKVSDCGVKNTWIYTTLGFYWFAKTFELKCKFYVSILKSASQLSNFRHSHYYGHETKNWNGYSINDVMHIFCAPFANIANEHIHTYYTVWKANFATITSFEGFFLHNRKLYLVKTRLNELIFLSEFFKFDWVLLSCKLNSPKLSLVENKTQTLVKLSFRVFE